MRAIAWISLVALVLGPYTAAAKLPPGMKLLSTGTVITISAETIEFNDSKGKKSVLAVTTETKFCDEKGDPLMPKDFKAGEQITTATPDGETAEFVQKGVLRFDGTGFTPVNHCN